MKSPVKGLIDNIHLLLDNTITVDTVLGSTVTPRAYTSVMPNVADHYILIENPEETKVPVKDRHMVEGVISIMIVERAKEDAGSFLVLHRIREGVEAALAPTLNYNVSSGSDGTTTSFYRGNSRQETDYNEGDGKVLKMILEVNYRAEWN